MSKSSNGAAPGYTIVELTVVMLIFSVVMTLISVSFARIVRSSGPLVKSAETDIGGLIGLEVMRSDLELAGFGLYWSGPGGGPPAINYIEAPDDLVLVHSCPDAKPSLYDDRTYTTDRYIPRAYRVGNDVGYNGSDYLVLKGVALGTSRVSRAWGYLNYSTTKVVNPPRGAESQPFQSGARVIVLRSGMTGGRAVRELVLDGSQYSVSYGDPFPTAFAPKEPGDNFLVYGVDKQHPSGAKLSFPFNRADYYINRPAPDRISPTCAPGTGILYKTVITQSGEPAYYPILDCVADLQVVLYMDINGKGEIDYHPDAEELDALETREQLKEIRVYILAQQGRRDDAYLYPVVDPDRAILVGDPELMKNPDGSLGRIWSSGKFADTFGPNWRNYRWRLYTIVVQPKNL